MHILFHISFKSKKLEYIFGVGDEALHSPRNVIFMYSTIEKGFDDGWITTVSHGDIEATPTESIIVLLNEAIKNRMTVYVKLSMTEITQWKF